MADPTVTITHKYGDDCNLDIYYDGNWYEILGEDGLELPETLGDAILAVEEWQADIAEKEES